MDLEPVQGTTGHEVGMHPGLKASSLQSKHRTKHMWIMINMFIVLIITSKLEISCEDDKMLL